MIDLTKLNDFTLLSVKLAATRQIEGATKTIKRCVAMRERGEAVAKGYDVVGIDAKDKRKSKKVGRAFYTWRSTGSSPYDIIKRAEPIKQQVDAEFCRRYGDGAEARMEQVAEERRALMLSYKPDEKQPEAEPMVWGI